MTSAGILLTKRTLLAGAQDAGKLDTFTWSAAETEPLPSLERIGLSVCPGITDAGLPFLARLPALREIDLSGLANVTAAGAAVFPPHVRVKYSP